MSLPAGTAFYCAVETPYIDEGARKVHAVWASNQEVGGDRNNSGDFVISFDPEDILSTATLMAAIQAAFRAHIASELGEPEISIVVSGGNP